MSAEWDEVYRREQKLITGHPKFNKLIREVAIAEPIHMSGLRWLQRNSRTYGSWVGRQSDGSHWNYRTSRRRANLLCTEIARELFPAEYEDRPSEQEAKVYVAALQYVRARQLHATTEDTS